jgi:putative hydrolase of the HAD superfamily
VKSHAEVIVASCGGKDTDNYLKIGGCYMNRPKMIIFDYGNTIVKESASNILKGTEAVLREASNNPNNVTPEEINALADELNAEIGRYSQDFEKDTLLEVHNHIFQKYLYEYFEIELTKTSEEVERIFETVAFGGEPTKDIGKLLSYIDTKEIRSSVISNISFSGSLLNERIIGYVPGHKFEFIIASSEYIFRKPHKRIFELALRKAKLEPCDVWYCGDNAVCDVDGASACGIYPVWYKGALDKPSKYIPKSNHLVVNDWNELIEILDSL